MQTAKLLTQVLNLYRNSPINYNYNKSKLLFHTFKCKNRIHSKRNPKQQLISMLTFKPYFGTRRA